MINPAWVKLNTSRGFESPGHKLFMRYTGNLASKGAGNLQETFLQLSIQIPA